MEDRTQRRRFALSWLFVGILLVLCGVLGVLQYRWIGEVSIAARDRMHAALQASLERIGRDFQTEIATACRAIAPANPDAVEAELGSRYAAWKASRHGQLFRGFALAVRENDAVSLRVPDGDGRFQAAAWPGEWSALRNRIEAIAAHGGRGFRGMGPAENEGSVIELPIFGGPADREGRRPTSAWLIFDVDPKYFADSVLPELMQRHLGASAQEYQYEIVQRSDARSALRRNADASVSLLDGPMDTGRGGRGGPHPGGPGRWEMFVRHRAGSLEAVVAKARMRNLAVNGGLLLLIIASALALTRFTRRAQKLAQLQMDFVAGVSHELRTPLAVINTAAYNLQSAVARNPEQVARYGALIRQESGRLKDLVEQVLTFAGLKAGGFINETQPLSVEGIIDASVNSSRMAIEGAHCVVEKHVAPDLPLIAGDAMALQRALQNLLTNAVKYGTEGSNWIGVSAAAASENGKPVVEIRVADRGPGIPADEQPRIFDAFFRGKRAQQDQIHGTGLGLSLVKEIVAAHRGSVGVRSDPQHGTEFVVRIPAAPPEYQNEFATSVDRG